MVRKKGWDQIALPNYKIYMDFYQNKAGFCKIYQVVENLRK